MQESDRIILDELCQLAGYRNPNWFIGIISEWAHIFRSVLDHRKNVAEFGSGFSPKMQFSLKDVQFDGHLTLVDIDHRALEIQRFVASKIKPAFTLVIEHQDLYNFPLDNQEMVVGNHLLDDLIAVEFASRYNIDYGAVFNDPNSQPKFWTSVGKEKRAAADTLRKLSDTLSNIPSGGIVILNHYTSNFDYKHGIQGRDEVCNGALNTLKELLLDKGFVDYTQQFPPENSLKRWLIVLKDI